MKKIFVAGLVLTLILALAACSSGNSMPNNDLLPSQPADNSTNEPSTMTNAKQTSVSSIISVEYDSDDLDSSLNSAGMSYINLEGDSITLDGNGAIVDGSTITITSAGTYSVSGTLIDGQIKVDTQDKETVKLVLNGVDITCSTSAPIYIVNAEKAVITLAEGTDNRITDVDSYIFEDAASDEPNAAIFSHDDLTINGDGSLTVEANYNNGIQSKDDLIIVSGNINVSAINDGIKGRDSIAVRDGNITVNAGGDGLQSNNNEDSERGYIAIEGGTLNITAGLDGIQAETSLVISAGNITITSGGGSINSSSNISSGRNAWGDNPSVSTSSVSAKGLKSGVNVIIMGGTINIDSSDDAIHSNNSLTIDDGVFLLKSGDDGIRSEYSLTINGGDISVLQSYEGFESAVITINDGNVYLVTSGDGLNARSGGGGGQVDGSYLYLNGGYILIDASGDGLDSNGTAIMTGGFVIVQGPAFQGNGPLDVNGEFEISGGFLIAAGSAGMPEIPSTSSTQNSIAMVLDSTQPGGTIIHIESTDGEEILTYESPKDYQLFVFTSPKLQANTTYNMNTGGDSTGKVTNGLYSGGTYTAGTQATSFTISGTVTTIGSATGGFPGGMRR